LTPTLINHERFVRVGAIQVPIQFLNLLGEYTKRLRIRFQDILDKKVFLILSKDITKQYELEQKAKQVEIAHIETQEAKKHLKTLNKTLKERDEALKTAKLAEKAQQDFFNMITHELRTPLNAIIGIT